MKKDVVVRVNMSTLEASRDLLPEKYLYLAGRALSSQYISDNVNPLCNPLGPHNRLVLTCGFLAGTTISSANRLSIGAKSPLTGGIKESNAGGTAAFMMGRLGIRMITIEGIREDTSWYILVIDRHDVKLIKANELAGKSLTLKAEALRRKYGDKIGLTLIGPAGERKQVSAGIATTDMDGVPSRYSARGGLGAVLGSKRLLGVVYDDRGCPPPRPENESEYQEAVKSYYEVLRGNEPALNAYSKYGTAAVVDVTNTIGGMPIRNFSQGSHEHANNINAATMCQLINQRGGKGKETHACMPGCVIRCSNVYPDENGELLVSPLEYETIGLLGSNLGIYSLDVIAKLNRMCNDYGVDTIEVGCAIGTAMEAGVISFGDAEGAMNLLQQMIDDTYLGKIIAAGCVTTGRIFGVRRVPAVKGQGMAAYEPRAIKGNGVTYMTSPMGADHTAGNTIKANVKHHLKDNQAVASEMAQLDTNLLDGLGLCIFVGGFLKGKREVLVRLINSYRNWNLSLKDFEDMAFNIMKTETIFNRQAGFTKADDVLPEFFYDEENPSSGSRFDVNQEDLKEMAFYKW